MKMTSGRLKRPWTPASALGNTLKGFLLHESKDLFVISGFFDGSPGFAGRFAYGTGREFYCQNVLFHGHGCVYARDDYGSCVHGQTCEGHDMIIILPVYGEARHGRPTKALNGNIRWPLRFCCQGP